LKIAVIVRYEPLPEIVFEARVECSGDPKKLENFMRQKILRSGAQFARLEYAVRLRPDQRNAMMFPSHWFESLVEDPESYQSVAVVSVPRQFLMPALPVSFSRMVRLAEHFSKKL